MSVRSSMRSLLTVGFAAALIGLTAGCSSDGGSLPTTTMRTTTTLSEGSRAEAACRAIDSTRYYNSAPGTVGEARSFTMGPGTTPLARVFLDQPATAFVAWCWFHNGNGYWAVVSDGRGNKADVGVFMNDAPAPGPPIVG